MKYYCIQYLQLQWVAVENGSLRLSLTSPAGSGAHIGFIVNHPTELALAVRSAEQSGAPKTAPLYLGGPLEPTLLFALVRRTSSPSVSWWQK